MSRIEVEGLTRWHRLLLALCCTLPDDVTHVHPLHPVNLVGILGLGLWGGIEVKEAGPAHDNVSEKRTRRH